MKRSLLFLLLLAAGLHSRAQDSLYHQTEVVLATAQDTIRGTLAIPRSGGKHVVALLIAGSGPTDRNGNNPMARNAALQLLADTLAKRGIATLRYDKRGIGASAPAMGKESDLRFEHYINDAAGWIRLLKKDKRFSKVYVIGHSEGSLIGMASAAGTQGFISIAGAGFPAGEVLKKQLASLPEKMRETSRLLVDSLQSGHTVSSAPITLYSLFRPSVQPYLISWFRYDPRVLVRTLRMPVLVLQGTNDLQVTVEDADALKAANPRARMLLIPGMNHVLRIVPSDTKENMKSYGDASRPLAPELVKAILDFLTKK
ncbi:MAG: alpha/beta hydrolase fold protein [Flaviaesturariibacter sp.]|nr:alpha/beta hydrolase fold protein [Flaviaesturariibacter sp.]